MPDPELRKNSLLAELREDFLEEVALEIKMLLGGRGRMTPRAGAPVLPAENLNLISQRHMDLSSTSGNDF